MSQADSNSAKIVVQDIGNLLSQGRIDAAVDRFSEWQKRKKSNDQESFFKVFSPAVLRALSQSVEGSSHALGKATLYLETGFAQEAERCLRSSIEKSPSPAELLVYADALNRLGRVQQSLAIYEQAARSHPDNAEIHFEMGRLMQALGKLSEARVAFEKASALAPGNAQFWLEFGNVHKQLGNLSAAGQAYTRAIEFQKGYAEAYNNRGTILKHLKRMKEAYADFSQAIKINPRHLYAYLNRGALLADTEQYEAAQRDFEMALAIAPDDENAYHSLGEVLHRLGKNRKAIRHFDTAILLSKHMSRAYLSKGNCQLALDEFEGAVESFKQSTQVNDQFLEGYINWGVALQEMGRHSETIEVLDKSLTVRSDFNEAKWNKANSMLCLGLSKDAWQNYEKRHHLETGKQLLDYGKPILGDTPPDGLKLLLQWDQRFGDIIQVMRFVKPIEKAAAGCVWQMAPEMEQLVKASFPDIEIVNRTSCPDNVGFRLPITSLPLALGVFDDASVPNETPYLVPSPKAVEAWRERIPSEGFKVGLTWRGRPTPPGRSILIGELEPILATTDVTLVSLQMDTSPSEKKLLEKYGVLQPGDDIETFDDTAAILSMLDLTVTIDTSVAHLSGALGRTTWVLLKFGGDWRWHLEGTESLWYPTAKIYRQSEISDWSDVIKRAATDLAKLAHHLLNVT